MMQAEERPVVDRIEGVALPSESMTLVGHEAAAGRLATAYASGRMHHAWLISGSKGIGKATLAFHFARHILQNPQPDNAPAVIDPSSWSPAITGQVAGGGHPGLLHLTRPWDSQTKRFKTQLPVEEIRRTQAFYGMTSSTDTWRVTIVDTADDMNASAANALLKILEEPPKRSLFLVLSNSAGRLLPTIRSRCQLLPLQPLSAGDVADALVMLGQNPSSPQVADLSEGSVRRALQLEQGDVLASFTVFEGLMAGRATGSAADWVKVHTMADTLARRGNEDTFAMAVDLMLSHIGHQARAGGLDTPTPNLRTLVGWAEVWEKANDSVRLADAFNLDRKQLILSLFSMVFDHHRKTG